MNGEVRAHVEIEIDDAIEMFRDINEYVVSLDRILSRIGTGGYDPKILVDYVVHRDVFRRIAKTRTTLGASLEAVLGDEAVDKIGEESYFYADPTS